MTQRRTFTTKILLNAFMICSCTSVVYLPFAATAATIYANVTVTPTATLSTIPTNDVGVNTAIWDGYLGDANTVPLLQAAGVKFLRYPGGSASDSYHWATNENVSQGGNFTWSGLNFQQFVQDVQAPMGINTVITVNYGSNETATGGGDPVEAANWVRYSNITHNYGIKYWEVGNEVYGNGYYANYWNWETDLHDTDQNANNRVGASSLSPSTYGQNVAIYSAAMKAVDPTIKVGAFLSLPGEGPGLASTNPPLQDWNSNVLAQCGANIDFVVLHWYPENQPDNDAQLLADPSQIAGFMSGVKTLINQYCGANAANVQIVVDETNSDPGTPGKQMLSTVNALFMADNIQSWLENGASNVDYWDLRNGAGNGDDSSTLFGTLQYGDEGILSNGSSTTLGNGTVVTEPAVDTPFPAYYAIQMTQNLGKPGDTMVTSSANQALLSTHAVKRADGSLGVLVINKDPSNSYNVSLNLSGLLHSASGSTLTYGPSTVTNISNTFTPTQSNTITLPPYTMETVSFGNGHTFSPGLQMISLPYDFTGTNPTTILSPVTPMAGWNPTSQTYGIAPSAPADAYRIGQGYWVRVPASYSSLVATGGTAAGANATISLSAGWNIIGDPYTTSIPESDMSVTVSGQATETLQQAMTNGVIGSTLYSYPEGASAYTPLDSSGSLQPFVGYWLYTTSNCTLTYTQPS